jgi:DNA-binding MarR family transcriptional regulator
MEHCQNERERLTGEQIAQLDQLQSVITRVLEALVLPLEAEIGEMPVLQLRCLRAIARRPCQSLGDIAKNLSVSLPSASRTVEKLVQSGLVERRSDPRDRRALHLDTTELSRAILARMQSARRVHLAVCTRGFQASEMTQVLSGLEMLADMAEKSYRSRCLEEA